MSLLESPRPIPTHETCRWNRGWRSYSSWYDQEVIGFNALPVPQSRPESRPDNNQDHGGENDARSDVMARRLVVILVGGHRGDLCPSLFSGLGSV